MNNTYIFFIDLINIFEVFLPQLLLYPNPTDPLNGEAAALALKEPEKYKLKVQGMGFLIIIFNYILSILLYISVFFFCGTK